MNLRMTRENHSYTFFVVHATEVELEGPFECSGCGGHIKIDTTFLEQVSNCVWCPYCGSQNNVEC